MNNVSIHQPLGPNATLNTKDMIISFGILNSHYEVFNDPTVFTFNANYEVTLTVGEEFEQRVTPLDIINCTEINYKEYSKYGYGEIFTSNDLGNYYCFNRTKVDKEIVIGGNFGSEFYGLVSAYITKCENGTNPNVICKPIEEINEKMNGYWFEVFFFLDHI